MADAWELLPESSEVLAIHAALLPTGKVLYFGGSEHDEKPVSIDATRLWNPATHSVERVSSPTDTDHHLEDVFCCGHCLLPTGDLLVAGGTEKYDKDAPPLHGDVHHFTGIRSVNVFDWRKETWRSERDMSEGRFYPTLITLQDGRVLAMSGHGSETGPHENTLLEIFDPVTRKWSAPFATMPPLEVTGGDFYIFGVHVIPMVYYPRLHLLPNRLVFSSTALRANGKRMTRSVYPSTGVLTTLADPPPGGNIGNMDDVYSRSAFASVMLPLKPPYYEERILICGEEQPRFFDPNNAQLGWRNAGSPRSYRMRAYLNAVLLPDATVLVVGGCQSEKGRFCFPYQEDCGGYDRDGIFYAEQYDPVTNSWQTLSSSPNRIARVYHSVALLLPDGRVWMAGSNHDSQRNKGGVREDHPELGDAREHSMEVYSPPYLFAKDAAGNDIIDAAGKPVPAVRPEIQWTRVGCSYNQEFPIKTAIPNQIGTVALIRCSSATHAFNPDQRYVELVIQNAKTTLESLTVSGPPTPEVAPPGYYLLFIFNGLNSAGTPSIGRFFRVSAEYPILEGVENYGDSTEWPYDFGTFELGQTREATFEFNNVGIGKLKVSNPTLSGDFRDKTIPADDCGTLEKLKNVELTLQADTASSGSLASLKVRFTPTNHGAYTGMLSVEMNTPDAEFFTIHLMAMVEELRLEISPQEPSGIGVLDFGSVPTNTTKFLDITVRNIGNVDVQITDISLSGASKEQFQIPFLTPIIRIGQVATLSFAYTPTVVSQVFAHAILTVSSIPGKYQKEYSIALRGVGKGPVVVFNPANLTFADQIMRTTSPAQTVILTNAGSAPLTIKSINVSSDFSQMNTCGTSLEAGQSCDINVSFRPGHADSLVGILTVESNAVGSFQPVVLTGTGLAEPVVALNPARLDFGDQPVDTGGAVQKVRLTNDGAAPLTIGGVNFTGTNQNDFVITTDSCSGAIIAPEGTCAVSVQFKPNASGSRSADLTFNDNAGGSPHRVALNGTGTPPPVLTLNPTSLAFGNQHVGSANAPQLVTLTNNGSTLLMVSNVQITGTNTSDFVINSDSCRGATVAPGDSCSVGIVFLPTAVGDRSAGLTFTDDAPNSPQTIPLDGTGVGPIMSIEPKSLVFPEQLVGSFSQRQEVTLRNIGNALLTITIITIDGDFKHDTFCGSTLVPGAYCQIRVICSPQAAGTRVGAVTVIDNAEGSPHKVPLHGVGIVPLAVLSPLTLAFGDQPVGSTSVPQTVTLTNTGLAVLTIENAHLTGANSGDFMKVTDSCTGSTLFPGDTCSVSVSFAPTATGSRNGSLTFEDNASDSPQSMLLTGNGL